MMYDELIEELRQHHCDAKEDDTQEVCEECAYDVIIADKSAPSGIASVCVCGLMNRAADAIEELQAVVDRLTAQTIMVFEKTEGRTVIKFEPKWISVTERLPEAGKKVLVFAYGYDTIMARMCKKTEDGYPVFECKGYDGIYREMARVGRISHWMPLPQPPKDGEP